MQVKKAQKFVNLIDAEIANSVFEYEKHFPHGAKIELFAPQREDQPFNRYFADWMAGKVLKETTRRNWESAFWKHLYPFFKDRLLSAPPGRIFACSRGPWWTRAWSPALSTISP